MSCCEPFPCGEGELYSYTVIRTPPEGFEEEAPYVVAVVRLDGGDLITCRLAGGARAGIFLGTRVRVESALREGQLEARPLC